MNIIIINKSNSVFIIIFARELVLQLLTDKQIKRESGESPGQSRCCETLIVLKKILRPLVELAGKAFRM